MNDLNEILWITQVQSDGNDIEICTLNARDGTWDRLTRIFSFSNRILETSHNGNVIITLKISDHDLSDEDPIIITDYHGQWLLRDFFKVPKKLWNKVKVQANE